MTREEAIRYGNEWLKDEYLDAKDGAFIKMSLKALEQEPEHLVNESGDLVKDLVKDTISRQAVLDTVLDKIRAEIDNATEIHSDGEFYIKNIDVKRIIDKYKGESKEIETN